MVDCMIVIRCDHSAFSYICHNCLTKNKTNLKEDIVEPLIGIESTGMIKLVRLHMKRTFVYHNCV